MARLVPEKTQRKLAIFAGSSLRDLKDFPVSVRERVGFAISAAQHGGKHDDAKPWKGINGAFEIVTDFDGDAFRTVYLVALPKAVYILHAFQKKSKKGIETPKKEKDIVKKRLADAIAHHKEHYEDSTK